MGPIENGRFCNRYENLTNEGCAMRARTCNTTGTLVIISSAHSAPTRFKHLRSDINSVKVDHFLTGPRLSILVDFHIYLNDKSKMDGFVTAVKT